ncbi:M48 family metallopeptidase [Chloroflexota bacterium]
MVDVKTVKVNNVGLVFFERSEKAKRINITVKPFQGVRVAVPHNSSLKKAEEFVCSKKAWINKHLEKIRQYENKYNVNGNKAGNIDKEKARTILVKRLYYLAAKNGFSYNRVFIRNQKTRWGSCSSKNNISLNMKLVILPEELIDYVILHELVHTKKKNHSKDFWTEMDKLVEHSKEMRSRLRQYGMELY